MSALNERARGWLRHIHEKATTDDDWTSAGEPHRWWDRDSTAPMCAFPRFDLSETAYSLPLMAAATPAWREVYTEIAAGLVQRNTSYWAAIDWITLIGADPNVDRYPPEWLPLMPEKLRGAYEPPGWTANGVEPWGLQPDPIGSDGNVFFRGFFNLILSVYASVSGEDTYRSPFEVTGYRDRRFEWTHQDIARLISAQLAARPEGPHCENTKIWPYCVSAAGLGLKLFDTVYRESTQPAYDGWLEYAQEHYMGLDRRGELAWFAAYFDPIEGQMTTFDGPAGALMALIVTPYVYPQQPEFGRRLYELAMRRLRWDDPKVGVMPLLDDPRMLAIGLVMAHELGDTVTEGRLRDHAEREFEPRRFGGESDRFGWFFGWGEEFPRGQLSALLMLPELGDPGSWFDAFNNPDRSRFGEPTVVGVDYPTMGICEARNDHAEGELVVGTYAARLSHAGRKTTLGVRGLPDPASVRVICDGEEFSAWRVSDEREIELELAVGEHDLRIATGYRPGESQPDPGGAPSRSTLAQPSRPAGPVGPVGPEIARPSAAAAASIAGCPCC